MTYQQHTRQPPRRQCNEPPAHPQTGVRADGRKELVALTDGYGDADAGAGDRPAGMADPVLAPRTWTSRRRPPGRRPVITSVDGDVDGAYADIVASLTG